MQTNIQTRDGNDAVVHVAYRLNEIIAIYPITPSTSVFEFSDAWSSDGVKNIWGTVQFAVEMKSEAGAAKAQTNCGNLGVISILSASDIHLMTQ